MAAIDVARIKNKCPNLNIYGCPHHCITVDPAGKGYYMRQVTDYFGSWGLEVFISFDEIVWC